MAKHKNKAASQAKTGAAAMAQATRGRARVFRDKNALLRERVKLVAEMRRRLGDWDE